MAKIRLTFANTGHSFLIDHTDIEYVGPDKVMVALTDVPQELIDNDEYEEVEGIDWAWEHTGRRTLVGVRNEERRLSALFGSDQCVRVTEEPAEIYRQIEAAQLLEIMAACGGMPETGSDIVREILIGDGASPSLVARYLSLAYSSASAPVTANASDVAAKKFPKGKAPCP